MLKWWGRRGRHVGDACQSAPDPDITHSPYPTTTTAVDHATGINATESVRATRSIDDLKPLFSPSREDGPRLFSLLRRHNNNVGTNGDNNADIKQKMDKMDAEDSDKPETLIQCRNMQEDATAINSEVPTSGSGTIDAMRCVDEMKYLLPHNEPFGTEDAVTILWKRRRQREHIRKLKSLVGGGDAASLPGDLASDTFTLSRALELESTLQQSNPMNDRTMIPMHVMLAKEKAMEDYLYDTWDQNMNMLAAQMVDEEPEFGYDNKGLYEQLTTCDDREGYLES